MYCDYNFNVSPKIVPNFPLFDVVALTHHVVEALGCKLSGHLLDCFFKHSECFL